MPKVKRLNKILDVSEASLPSYLKDGFDQINEEGEVIQRATGGRTVSLAEYNQALDRIKELEAELSKGTKPKRGKKEA